MLHVQIGHSKVFVWTITRGEDKVHSIHLEAVTFNIYFHINDVPHSCA